jgi:hypothetical protein
VEIDNIEKTETKTPDQVKKEKTLKEVTDKIGFKVDDVVVFRINLIGGPIQVSRDISCLVKSITPKGGIVSAKFAIQDRDNYKDEGSRIFEMNFFLISTAEYDLKARDENGNKVIKYEREWSSSLRFYS